MARYKATVIFDVHENENRERRDQLAKKVLRKEKRKGYYMAYSQTAARAKHLDA
jgi:hypothetical protein